MKRFVIGVSVLAILAGTNLAARATGHSAAATINKDGMFDPETSPLEVEMATHG